MSTQRRVISFREKYYEKFKKIEMKIIYIILNVHNFFPNKSIKIKRYILDHSCIMKYILLVDFFP